jgi:presenilin-like A22 family membrane protease
MLGTIAGTLTLYSGLIFTIKGSRLDEYYFILVMGLFLFNLVFLIKWLFLYLVSLKIKHSIYVKFMKVFSIIMREKTYTTMYSTRPNMGSVNLSISISV